MTADVVLTGWYVGWAIGAVVVVLVAVLVVAILFYTNRIAGQAERIDALLESARNNTDSLWTVVDINRTLERGIGRRPGPPRVLQKRG